MGASDGGAVMAGASIHVRLNDEGFAAGLERLAGLGRNTGPLLRAIGTGMVDATQRHFESATDPEGRPWHGLNPAYASTKKGAGILREAAIRGGLMGSITFSTGPHSVRWGSNKVYAAIHQFGGTIKPVHAKALRFHLGGRWVSMKQVTIPARPYLGFGKLERQIVAEALDDAVDDALRAV